MSRLHRQPGSRNARPEFPEFRAYRVSAVFDAEARSGLKAGLSA
jgi:hypothetical protein